MFRSGSWNFSQTHLPILGKMHSPISLPVFFVAEIIREKALLIYQKEVPYSIEVVVEEFKEEIDIIRIRAIILVERETQKGIVIGHKGDALKRLGIMARKDIELFFEKKNISATLCQGREGLAQQR